jgi:magnesium-transporting ATPase (P-type)
MRNPRLYNIGIKGLCFGKMEMLKWVLYACWHAVAIYYLVFFALTVASEQNNPRMNNGMDLGFWIAGHGVYGVCVFISNIVLAHKFHHHQWGGTGLFALMIFAFFFIIGIQSIWPSPSLFADLNHIF